MKLITEMTENVEFLVETNEDIPIEIILNGSNFIASFSTMEMGARRR